MSEPSLLDVENLRVAFATDGAPVEALRSVSFTMGRERVAIVGESGSGKSVTVRALLGLLTGHAAVTATRATFLGRPLLDLSPRSLRRLRGRHIAMVVQDPKQGLDPVRRIGWQLAEMLQLHRCLPWSDALRAAPSLLREVQIRDPEHVAGLYPHQLSGGMAQRAMIAMMLAGEPELLIADEATSALDAAVQDHILGLIDREVRRRAMGLILISHDLELVGRFADRVLVMYGGRIVESVPGGFGLVEASHPYTRGLLACRPGPATVGQRLPVLERDPAWLQ